MTYEKPKPNDRLAEFTVKELAEELSLRGIASIVAVECIEDGDNYVPTVAFGGKSLSALHGLGQEIESHLDSMRRSREMAMMMRGLQDGDTQE